MQGKLAVISSVSLGILTRNKDFGTPLALGSVMLPRFLPLAPSFTVKQALKNFIEFLLNFVNILPNVYYSTVL